MASVLRLQSSRNSPEATEKQNGGTAQNSPCATSSLSAAVWLPGCPRGRAEHREPWQASSAAGALLHTNLLQVLVCPDGR